MKQSTTYQTHGKRGRILGFKLKQSSAYYINKIIRKLRGPSLANRALQAQSIFKWCNITRNSYITNIMKFIEKIQSNATTALMRANECKVIDFSQKNFVQALCGDSHHTRHTEQYHYESGYCFDGHSLNKKNMLFNNKRQIMNVLPVIDSSDRKKN